MKTKIKFSLLLALIVSSTGFAYTPPMLSAQELVALVNQDRASHGLSLLKLNPTLNLAALAKAEDMVSKNYFGHVSPDGTKPWYFFKTLGYDYSYAGENLARNYRDAKELENSWMTSKSHRDNILSPNYSDLGLAVVQKNNQTIVVQLFGSQLDHLTIRR
jgi:uncharacterized protein YkwD